MPSLLASIVRRIRELAAAGRVRFTHKALCEIAALDLGADDAVDVLCGLSLGDAHGILRSEGTREPMYVFKPTVGGVAIYVKVAIRDDCIVVYFHEDEADP